MKIRIAFSLISLFLLVIPLGGQPVLLPYLSGDKYGVSDENGNLIIAPKYDAVITMEDYPVALVRQDSLWGLVNLKDEVLLPLKIADKENTHNFRRMSGPVMGVRSPGIIDRMEGKSFSKVNLIRVHDTAHDVYYYVNPFAPQPTYTAFIDPKKNNPRSEASINSLSTGFVKVGTMDGKINFLDTTGQLVFREGIYDGSDLTSFAFAVKNEENLYAVYNRKGVARTSHIYTDLSSTGLLFINDGDLSFIVGERENPVEAKSSLYTLFDKYGKVIISDYPRKIHVVGDHAILNSDEGSRLIDTVGKVIYDHTEGTIAGTLLRKDIFIICRQNLCGVISEAGEIVLQPEYEQLDENIHGDWLFRKGKNIGLLDRKFRVKWTRELPDAEVGWNFDTDYLYTRKMLDSTFIYGLIDTLGNTVLETLYTSMSDPSGEKFLLVEQDSLNGVFDNKGKPIIPMTDSLIELIRYRDQTDFNLKDGIYLDTKTGKRIVVVPKPSVKVNHDNDYAVLTDMRNQPLTQKKYTVLKRLQGLEVSRALFLAYLEDTYKREVINELGKNIIPEGFYVEVTEVDYTVGGLVYVFLLPNEEALLSHSIGDRELSGIVDADGLWVIPPDSTIKKILGREFIQVQKQGSPEITLYNRHGKLVEGGPFSLVPFMFADEKIPNDRLMVGRPESWKKYYQLLEKQRNAKGQKYYKIDSLLSSMQLMGFIDHTGKVIIPLKYTDLDEFEFRHTTVSMMDKKGKQVSFVIDVNGKELMQSDYNLKYLLQGDSSLVVFEQNGFYGVMDLNEDVLIKPRYNWVTKDTTMKRFVLEDESAIYIAPYDDPEDLFRIGPKGNMEFFTNVDFDYSVVKTGYGEKNYYTVFDKSGRLIHAFEGFSFGDRFMDRKLPAGYMSVRENKEGLEYVVNVRTGMEYRAR